MKISNFFSKLILVLMVGFVFSGCIKSPDKGDPGIELMQASRGDNAVSSGAIAVDSSPDETSKFKTPLADGVDNTQEDLMLIRESLAESYDLNVDEVQATIEGDSSVNYATGYVNVGEGEKGGVYFAAKKDGEWVIAYDGFNILNCSMIEGYDFPTGMIPRCYSMETGLMVDR